MVKKSSNQMGTIIIVLLVVAGLIYLVMMMNNKNVNNTGNLNLNDSVSDSEFMQPNPEFNNMIQNAAPVIEPPGVPSENDVSMNKMNEPREGFDSSCYPKEQLTAKDLLPQNESSTWAQVNPSGMGSLKDKNFLQAGHHIGINTVGQTLRNANLQLRSEPPNPQVTVSPWMQTTINPDMNRKPFEIGGCA